jgi:hypothetical protein
VEGLMLALTQLVGFGAGVDPPARSLHDAIVDASLTSGLLLCLDAATISSWPGSGQSWLDLSGNGRDFFRGADGSASTDDPTFNGSANGGSASEYWSTDAGDFFRYDAGVEAWQSALHQDNAAFTILATVYAPTGATTFRVCGTQANDVGNPGIAYQIVDAIGAPRIQCLNGTGAAISVAGDTSITADDWNFIGISLNEATGAGGAFHYLNGAYNQVSAADTFTSTYTSPSAAAANFAMEIFAEGNATQKSSSGCRIAQLAIWSTALTKANLDSIFADAAVSTRFGL